jgi:predicted transcriptional regulator
MTGIEQSEQSKALLSLTAEIVAAHVKNNQVATSDLPALIEQVFVALRDAGGAVAAPAQVAARVEPERPAPVVSPKKSVFPDYIICLEDGRKLKTLKRHLRSTYNMTPEQYREKWDLPADYPMVAPNYAEHRSALAKQLGLGRKPAAAAAVEPERVAVAPAPAPAPVLRDAPPERMRDAPPERMRDAPPERMRDSRSEPTADSVFARFPQPAAARQEPPPAPEPDGRKPRRKPFSKQLARSMRP